LVPGSSGEEVIGLGEQLRTAVCGSPLAIAADRTLSVTISAGCSVGPIDGLTEAIRVADEALYEAKQTGRNRVTSKAMNL
jgi:diguanylate cyclase (GGDEF)-like protein